MSPDPKREANRMGLIERCVLQAIREYNDRLRFDLEQQDAEIKRLRDQCNQLDGLVEQHELQLEGAVAALELIADPLGWPPSLRNKEYVVHMRNLAADAIRRGAVSR